MSKRKRYRPRPVLANALGLAIGLARKLPVLERLAMDANVSDAVERLLNGAPDCGEAGHAEGCCGNAACLPAVTRNRFNDAWRTLADASNVAEELMRVGLANDHAETFRAAQLVLKDAADRIAAGGARALSTEEGEALRVMALVHRVQLQHVSLGELQAAVQRVARRVSAALRDPAVRAVHVAGNINKERTS